jgi:sialate O-acetylesterase
LVLLLVLGLSSVVAAAPAEGTHGLRLPAVFADHMVLQQDKPAWFWGWADADTPISVTIQGRTHATRADSAGRWRLQTHALQPSDQPMDVVVAAGPAASAPVRTLRDVLVGEVWLCSGQSNMEMVLAGTHEAKAAIEQAIRPTIRLFVVGKDPALAVREDVVGQWVVCDAKSAAAFSAVGYYFAVTLQDQTRRPVGMICSAWGGTGAESWISHAGMARHPVTDATLRNAKPLLQKAADLPRALSEDDADWANPGLAIEGWNTIKLPLYFDYALTPGEYDGVIWARRTVTIPPQWEGRPLDLHLGKVDDFETTYFNGIQVGQTRSHTLALRQYKVPAELVKAGPATLAVKVTKVGWGGIFGPADAMKLFVEGEPQNAINLAGDWHFRPSQLTLRHLSPSLPGSLYNGMVGPLAPMSLRGAIWYQGEANAYADSAWKYRDVLATLILDWRARFQQDDLAFGIVQLTAFRPPVEDPNAISHWAMLRESQRVASAAPRCGLAVTIDVGDASDIHPRNKRDVGHRLGLWALAEVYGQNIAFSGPVFRSMTVVGRRAVLEFDHVGQGLRAEPDGALRHFALAGADRKFHWATARIEGATVVVESEHVSAPVAVRYGWADNPAGANLRNADGLPATPFRTDNW